MHEQFLQDMGEMNAKITPQRHQNVNGGWIFSGTAQYKCYFKLLLKFSLLFGKL